jgi:electron transfer flavoprotein alpha/beta subunit
VTAFLVDRHAEGLVVGKDEEKMGQCGSPTNELSLTAVRVPYENVAGLEGRGQVNALETLNVGRAGLAVSAVSLMGQLIDEADEFARRRWQRPPRWVDEALDQMRDDRFACESLAYELIGRFDHPGTQSVRMESAIAKMAVSEALHAMIEQAEDVYGLLGQTRALRIEKHKRDARILNIYEGTNEVQRFFILKDLINEIAPRARALVSSPPPTGGGGLGWGARPDSLCSVHSALEPCVEPFEANRRALLERLEAAVERFGRDGWLNPNLQPSLFTLSEAASWLLMWASSLRRSHQLLTGESDPAERAPILDRAARLTARIHDQVLTALGRFDEDFDALGHGFYPPVIRAAELAFEPGRREPASERPTSATGARRWAGAKRNVVVVVEPRPELSPEPVISDGRIDEVYYRLGAADSAALDAALDLAHTSNVHVTVAAVGPRRADAVLREALARGADEALLVVAPYEPTDPAAACEALATALADDERAVDLLLSRPPSASGEVGWSGVLLAARLGIPWYGTRQGIDLDDSAAGNEALLVRDAGDARAIDASATERAALPIACAVEIAGESPREFTTTGWLDSLRRPLRYAAWPAEVPLPDSRVRLAHRSSADLAEQDGKGGQAAHATRVSTPDEAAAHFLEIAGVHGPTGPAVFASSLTLPSPNGRGVGGEGGRTEADGGAAPEGGEATWHVRESDFDLVNPLGEIDEPCAVAILVADRHGKFASGEQSVLTAVARVAREWKLRAAALVLGSGGTDAEAQVGRHLAASRIDLAWIWRHRHFSPDLPELCRRALESGWQTPPRLRVVVAASWAAESLALLARGGDASAYGVPPAIGFGVSHLEVDGTSITVEAPWGAGRLVRSSRRGLDEGSPIWLGVSPAFEAPRLPAPLVGRSPLAPAALWASDIPLEDWFSRDVVARAARESRQHSGERSGLAHADVIVDVGAGIRNRDCLDEVIEPLVRALKRLGIESVEVGGSRKVVEELGLLPADRQIGQTGQSVNPKLLLAVGISGAPQHLDYIGPRATVFSFNRDPEAPIMTLNRRAPRPRVVPIVGDLFETVPDFIRTLARRAGASAPDHHEIGKRADNVDEPTKVALG